MKYYRVLRERKFLFLLIGALLVGTFMGCQNAQTTSELESEHQRLTNVIRHQLNQSKSGLLSTPSKQVVLEAGDEIELKFYYTPELDVTQVVRPDGKISLQLIGEIDVRGMSPAELRAELLRLYVPYLKKPEIAVIVRSLLNRRVYVGGQVMTPGVVEIPGEISLLEAIMQAGGFLLPEAKVKNVVVIRHNNGQRYSYAVNMKDTLKGKGYEPFILQPQDIVYVPRTTITKVDQWVDQHINRLMPETGLYITQTRGRTTIGYRSRY